MPAVGLTDTARWILDEGERQGRELLHTLGQQGKVAATNGLKALNDWRQRTSALLELWADKRAETRLSTLELTRALESERDALAFTLAAIANEEARGLLATLLGTTLRFLGNVFGAALAGAGR